MISICIPAYKRVDYLKRLLDSISAQDYRDFEVIVSDDSPDESVEQLCSHYQSKFSLRYFKNVLPYGTPENWNQAISKANGDWIKLMHDDDWFYDGSSLGKFAEAADLHGSSLLFSAYQNVFLDENRSELVYPSAFRLKHFSKEPATLLSRNIVGPPSVIMHPKNLLVTYDKATKWVVDIDFYIQVLKQHQFYYIPEVLVSVGMSQEQVTASCSRIPEVEIPENLYLMNKIGWKYVRNILVFDSLWRLLRNFRVQSVGDLRRHGYTGEIPDFITKIMAAQSFWGGKLLSVGVISKLLMSISYFKLKGAIKS